MSPQTYKGSKGSQAHDSSQRFRDLRPEFGEVEFVCKNHLVTDIYIYIYNIILRKNIQSLGWFKATGSMYRNVPYATKYRIHGL